MTVEIVKGIFGEQKKLQISLKLCLSSSPRRRLEHVSVAADINPTNIDKNKKAPDFSEALF